MTYWTKHRTAAAFSKCNLCDIIVNKELRSRPLTPLQKEHRSINAEILTARVSKIAERLGWQPMLSVQPEMELCDE